MRLRRYDLLTPTATLAATTDASPARRASKWFFSNDHSLTRCAEFPRLQEAIPTLFLIRVKSWNPFLEKVLPSVKLGARRWCFHFGGSGLIFVH